MEKVHDAVAFYQKKVSVLRSCLAHECGQLDIRPSVTLWISSWFLAKYTWYSNCTSPVGP